MGWTSIGLWFSESVGFAWTNGFTLDSYSDLDVTVTDTFKNVSHDVSTSDKDTEDPDGSCRFKWLLHTQDGYMIKAFVT